MIKKISKSINVNFKIVKDNDMLINICIKLVLPEHQMENKDFIIVLPLIITSTTAKQTGRID